MHAKPRRTPGYRGAHRRPSRLHYLLAGPMFGLALLLATT